MDILQEIYDRKPFVVKQGALHLWGIPLASRTDLCRVRQLYSFSGFFAELCYDKISGKPTCVCSFTSAERLAPYLEQINLDQLSQ